MIPNSKFTGELLTDASLSLQTSVFLSNSVCQSRLPNVSLWAAESALGSAGSNLVLGVGFDRQGGE